MPIRSDDPLRKVTLNLYEADCAWFEAEYGHGWTERLRQHVHNEVLMRANRTTRLPTKNRQTLADLAEDFNTDQDGHPAYDE